MKEPVNPTDFVRVNNDTNGNSRHVIHFLKVCPEGMRVEEGYRFALKLANKLGGRKYTAKHYGGGIVFAAASLPFLCERLNDELIKQGIVDSGKSYDMHDSLTSTMGDFQ